MNVAQLDEIRAIEAITGSGGVAIFRDGELVDDIDLLEQSNSEILEITVLLTVDLELSGVPVSLERAGEPLGLCGTVEHLPPVRLGVTYDPSSYLSECIPGDHESRTSPSKHVSISSCWMIGKAGSLEAELEQEIAELVNAADSTEPILIAAWGHLKQRLESLRGLAYDADDPSKMHRFLLAFNIGRRKELFRLQSHECSVCFEVKDGGRFVRFECGHAFCAECARALVTSHIDCGSVHVKCPDTSCRKLLEPQEIKKILDDDALFDTWNELSFKHGIASHPEYSFCPRCGGIAVEDAEENSADCGVCFYVFCTLCQESRHPGVECVSQETKLLMLRQRAMGGSADAVALLRKTELELKSLSLIEKTTKPCPSCGEAVERNQGCNKMTCLCGDMFCYRCGEKVTGYQHFKEGGACVLFDEAEILRWEREFHGMLAGGFGLGANHQEGDGADGADGGGRGAVGRMLDRHNQLEWPRCPCCGQGNYRGKELRNHLRCWSCRRHFCGRCLRALNKGEGKTHFGPNRCPQHERVTRNGTTTSVPT